MSTPVLAPPDRVPFAEAAARIEHERGVVPLLGLFDRPEHPTLRAVADGRARAALALYAPNAAFARAVPAVWGRRSAAGAALTGRFRVGHPAAVALVAAAFGEVTRLCLVPLEVRTPSGGWVELAGVDVAEELVSRPVNRDGPLARVLDGYASEYAALLQRYAGAVVAELRRGLACTAAGDAVFSTSQLLAHELTRLDIELSLLGGALRSAAGREAGAPDPAVTALLAAASDLAVRVAGTAANLVAELGLPPVDAGLPPDTAASAFGGRRMVEAELARRMGLLGERG